MLARWRARGPAGAPSRRRTIVAHMLLVVALLCSTLGAVTAATGGDDARRPPMGWRSWNLFEENVSQALLLQQVAGLVRVRHEGVSLRDLGYATVGLDDGWQDCSSGNGYHDPTTGVPKINDKFPDMTAMTAAAKQMNVSMGWYGNNCGCHGKDDIDRYQQDAEATVKYGYTGTKIDSCGPETNISAWREALDAASAKYGDGSRILIENCRNYAFTQNLTRESACEFELFRSTEDNAPDYLSIMHNLMTNAQAPGTGGNVHGGLPIAHQSCWSYADMLEVVGSGRCRQDLKPGTCNYPSAERPAGGLDLNESQAHFAAWAVVSSPLTIGHDLSNDAAYDAAWPVVSNRDAIRVNQAFAGDAGRLIATSSETLNDLLMFHGAGCECPYKGSLPRWAVFAKRLGSDVAMARDAIDSLEAGAVAINFGNSSLPASTIKLSLAKIFGDPNDLKRIEQFTLRAERDIWGKQEIDIDRANQTEWVVGELAPRSSYFALLRR